MVEAVQGEGKTGNSPARQMLAALTRASQEMTRKLNDSYEFVNRLNSTLESKVNERLKEINEHNEIMVRSHLEGLSSEKDAILAELTQIRQEELKVLQGIGKDLREALSARLTEMLDEVNEEVTKALSSFQEQLANTEEEVGKALAQTASIADEKLPALLTDLKEEGKSEQEKISQSLSTQKTEFEKKAEAGLIRLSEQFATLKNELDAEGKDYLDALESELDQFVALHSERIKEELGAAENLKSELNELLQAANDEFSSRSHHFAESSAQLRDLKLKLHKNRVDDLSSLYQTEILSVAKDCEDKMMIARSRIQTMLTSYHDKFQSDASQILKKFENAASEALPSADRKESDPDSVLPDSIAELLQKLRGEVRGMVKECTDNADQTAAELLENFRTELTNSSQNHNNSIEKCFSESRKEIMEISKANKESLEELAQKADALEQLMLDAKDLMSALDQTDLEF